MVQPHEVLLSWQYYTYSLKFTNLWNSKQSLFLKQISIPTLNARTSILAAANPIVGRYDRGRSLKQNSTVTALFMSRFDLFFVVLNKFEETAVANVAKFIISVHSGADSWSRSKRLIGHGASWTRQRYLDNKIHPP